MRSLFRSHHVSVHESMSLTLEHLVAASLAASCLKFILPRILAGLVVVLIAACASATRRDKRCKQKINKVNLWVDWKKNELKMNPCLIESYSLISPALYFESLAKATTTFCFVFASVLGLSQFKAARGCFLLALQHFFPWESCSPFKYLVNLFASLQLASTSCCLVNVVIGF